MSEQTEPRKDNWDINPGWLLPLLALACFQPQNDAAFSAANENKSVNLHFDPHDPESVKAAEVWVNALFRDKQPTPTFAPTVKAVRGGDTAKFVPPPTAALDDLRTAAEPLREYLRKYGDPHTSVTVTQDGATVKQDERGVKFRDDELLKRVKNAPLTADGTTATQPEPEPDALELDRLRGELVDPLPVDYLFLWQRVAKEYEKAWEAWSSGKRVRIPRHIIDALETLSKRLSADFENAAGIKSEPADAQELDRAIRDLSGVAKDDRKGWEACFDGVNITRVIEWLKQYRDTAREGTAYERNAKPKRDILNGRFSCDLPKYAADAWAAVAYEYGKLSGKQKTGETSVDVCEKLVADANTLRVYLQAQLDEARKFPRV